MKEIPFVDLKAGFEPIKDEVMKAIGDVLDGMNLNIGPNCQAFEKEFASFCGARYAIGVGSGTEAIQFALLACGIKEGDEGITTPHTFFATVEAISCIGARPVFVDIDPLTYNINPADIEKKITKKTKAIIPVHMYGQTAGIDPILEISKQYGISVIEDACQAHGALYKGIKAGALGDAGCFSFYFYGSKINTRLDSCIINNFIVRILVKIVYSVRKKNFFFEFNIFRSFNAIYIKINRHFVISSIFSRYFCFFPRTV